MDKVIIERYYPVYYPTYRSYPYWTTPIYGGVYGGYGTTNNCIIGNTTTNTANNITFGGTTVANTAMYTSNSADLFTTPISANMMSDLETGIVEKGSSSSQKFDEIEMDFEKNYISSTIIQILPESRKPSEVKEVFNKKTGEIKFKKEAEDVIELIKKLGELHSAGILTDAEFNTKKSELLSKI